MLSDSNLVSLMIICCAFVCSILGNLTPLKGLVLILLWIGANVVTRQQVNKIIDVLALVIANIVAAVEGGKQVDPEVFKQEFGKD